MPHSICSPSAAHRWANCPGAPAFESVYPNESSVHAEEGTLAHAIAAHALDPKNQPAPEGADALGDADREAVQSYIDFVERETADALVRHIEYRLSVGQVTGEAHAIGTADCLAIVGKTLKIIDLKFGRGVKVDAPENDQLAIYALAALDEFSLVYDIDAVEVVIFQPRISHLSTATYTVDALEEKRAVYGTSGREAMAIYEKVLKGGAIPIASLHPSEKACRWCRAKADCPALSRATALETGVDIEAPMADVVPSVARDNLERLSQKFGAVEQVEAWCAAVRSRAFSVLMDGQELPGYKLIAGRRGARRWTDDAAAESMLACLADEDRYTFKLVSPTQCERLAKKAALAPEVWEALQAFIEQPEGSPSIVPASDSRPAIQVGNTEDAFEDLTKE